MTQLNTYQPKTPTGDPAKLDLAIKIREYHHNAIWEEQKHFTWLISIILSAQLLVLTSDKFRASGKVLVVVGSVVGILLAMTGFRVQRREGSYFRNANANFVEEHNALYPHMQLPLPSQKANKNIFVLVLSFFTGKSGIRDYFQFLFLCFIVIFTGLAVYVYFTP
jgi:hypothetical protein